MLYRQKIAVKSLISLAFKCPLSCEQGASQFSTKRQSQQPVTHKALGEDRLAQLFLRPARKRGSAAKCLSSDSPRKIGLAPR